jgi:CDP-paratose synthetase
MNILITGATGFIGRNLLPVLAQKSDVRLITINRNLQKVKNLFPNLNCIHVSVDDLDKIEAYDPEIVFHFASRVTNRNDTNVIDDIIEANISFGVKLLDQLKSCSNLKLFVNVGSFAEYRLGTDKIDNAYLYTTTKTAFKQFVDYYSALSGYKYIHVVPYSIYGGSDSQKKIIDYIIESFDSTIPVKMTKGEQVLDFIHISDVVSFFVNIVDNIDKFIALPNGETLYLGTGKGTSIRELAELLEKTYQKRANIEWGGLSYRDKDVMHAVAPIGKLIELGWKSHFKIDDFFKI